MKDNIPSISIDNESCIQCGKCARVCPADIMIQKKKGGAIILEGLSNCIICGHCVDVCPTDSIRHSVFPLEKVHPINRSLLPTPEQVMLLIKSRRSARIITPRQIPTEMLEQIVEAARYAPTASNEQQVSFTLITNPEILLKVSGFTIKIFDSIANKLMNPLVRWLLKPFLKKVYDYFPAFCRLKREHEAGNDPILRKATALLFFHTPKSDDFGCANANLAYQNASLMAQSLGVSQIYMGFVIKAIKIDGDSTFSQMTGIEGKIHAIMALGMPAFNYLKYTER